MLNRRRFLKVGTAAGLSLWAGSMGSACSGLKRGDLSEESGENRNLPTLTDQGRSILHYASLAPSGHNAQPWRVRIQSPLQWIIEADPERRLPQVDPHNRELILSLGAFVENLSLAAETMGYTAEVQVIAGDIMARDMLQVSLHEDSARSYPLRRLALRRTIRHGLRPRELRPEDAKALLKPMNRHMVYFPRGTQHADCIAEAAVEAYRVQADRDAAQQELVEWLRLANADARRHRDGLTVASMEIKGIKGWLVRHFVDPEDFLKPAYRQQGIDMTAEQAGEGGGWFIITSQGAGVADLIATGRRFEHMALLARERNIAIHPMTQILEEKNSLSQVAEHHNRPFHPQFILRVGYVDNYPQPVSLRRPVEWFAYA